MHTAELSTSSGNMQHRKLNMASDFSENFNSVLGFLGKNLKSEL